MTAPLDVKNTEEAEAAGWKIEFGPGDMSNGVGWELVQKAWHEDDDSKTLHTTKRMWAGFGWLVETATIIYLGAREGACWETKSVSVSTSLTVVAMAMQSTPQYFQPPLNVPSVFTGGSGGS